MRKRGPQGFALDREGGDAEVEGLCARGLPASGRPRPHARFSACGVGLTSARRQWSRAELCWSLSLDVVEEAMQHLILCLQMLFHREWQDLLQHRCSHLQHCS